MIGYAVKRIQNPANPTGDTIASLSRRSFFARQVVWGPNTWSTHFEFVQNHVGAILERAEPGAVPTGFTSNNAWNLNPLDFHADGTLKDSDFVAALGLKTSTDRSGVAISVYNHADQTGGLPFDENELNQCEEGYDVPDLASQGTFQNDVLIDVQAAPWYGDNCDWAEDWSLPELTPVSSPCNTFAVGTGARLGVNLGDTVARRCPTYVTCQAGQSCCVGRFDASLDFTCAAKTDGTAWCWGNNGNGQLGDERAGGADARQVMKIDGSPLTGVLAVATGNFHACAHTSAGSVYCWGNNDNGQLGTTTGHVRAAPVPGLSAVSDIAVGALHNCARKTDGTLWCWGRNSSGQLGDGTTVNKTTPVQAGASTLGSAVAEVAVGGGHSCARKTDGTLWCWAANGYGQLGNSNPARRSFRFG